MNFFRTSLSLVLSLSLLVTGSPLPFLQVSDGTVRVTQPTVSQADAAYMQDDDAGTFVVDFTDSLGFLPDGLPFREDILHDTAADTLTLADNDDDGFFTTVTIIPESSRQWEDLTINGTQNGGTVDATILDCAGATLAGPISMTLGTPVDLNAQGLTPYDPVTNTTGDECIQVQVALGRSATDAPAPVVSDVVVEWDALPIFLVDIEAEYATRALTSEQIFTVRYSVSHVEDPAPVLYVELPQDPTTADGDYVGAVEPPIGYDLPGEDLTANFVSAKDGGQYTSTGLTVSGVTIPPHSVYWDLGPLDDGTTYITEFIIKSNNWMETGSVYELTPVMDSVEANRVDGNTATTENTSVPAPSLSKTETKSIVVSPTEKIYYYQTGSGILNFKLNAKTSTVANNREPIYNPILTDDLSDIWAVLSSDCGETDITTAITNITPAPDPSSSFYSGGTALVWTIPYDLNGATGNTSFGVSYDVDVTGCQVDDLVISNSALLTSDNGADKVADDEVLIKYTEFPPPAGGGFINHTVEHDVDMFVTDQTYGTNGYYGQIMNPIGTKTTTDDLIPGPYIHTPVSGVAGDFWGHDKNGHRSGYILPERYGNSVRLVSAVMPSASSKDTAGATIRFHKIPAGTTFQSVDILTEDQGIDINGNPSQINGSMVRGTYNVNLPDNVVPYYYDDSIGTNGGNPIHSPPEISVSMLHAMAGTSGTLPTGWTATQPANLSDVSWVALYNPCVNARTMPLYGNPASACVNDDPTSDYFERFWNTTGGLAGSGYYYPSVVNVTIDEPANVCLSDEIEIEETMISYGYYDPSDEYLSLIPADETALSNRVNNLITNSNPNWTRRERIYVEPNVPDFNGGAFINGTSSTTPNGNPVYNFRLNNTGPIPADSMTMTITVPTINDNNGGTVDFPVPTFDDGGTGFITSIDTSNFPNTIDLTLGSVAAFSAGEFDMTLEVPGNADEQSYNITATTSIDATTPCSLPPSPSLTYETRIDLENPSLEVTKSVDEPLILTGDEIHYNLEAENIGQGPARFAYVVDTIPNNTIIKEAYTTGTNSNGTTYTCADCARVYFCDAAAFGGAPISVINSPVEATFVSDCELGTNTAGTWVPATLALEDVKTVAWRLVGPTTSGNFPTGVPKTMGFTVTNDHAQDGGVIEGSPDATVIFNEPMIVSNDTLPALGNKVHTTIVSGQIGNQVWYDLDSDGAYEPDDGEAGIENVVIELLWDDDNDSATPMVPFTDATGAVVTATTDADGWYEFTDLPVFHDNGDGTYSDVNYQVIVATSNTAAGGPLETYDWVDGPNDGDDNNSQTPTGYDITLSYNDQHFEDLTGDFGYIELGTVGDFVFYDINGDGDYDTGSELPIENVELTLWVDLGDGNGFVAYSSLPTGFPDTTTNDGTNNGTTMTDATGAYEFGDLPLEWYDPVTDTINTITYMVEVTQPPAGLTSTEGAANGSNGDNTSNPDGDQDNTTPDGYQFTIDHDDPATADDDESEDFTGDFGYGAFGEVGDTVFYDTDGDGDLDTGENGIAGVELTLFVDLGDGNGLVPYSTSGLPPISTSDGTNDDTDVTDVNGNYNFGMLPLQYVDADGNLIDLTYHVEVSGPPAGVVSTDDQANGSNGESTANNPGDGTANGTTGTDGYTFSVGLDNPDTDANETQDFSGDFGYVATDLEVVKSVTPTMSPVGGVVTWDIEVTNNGPIDATTVNVFDQLPTTVAYVSYTATAGTYSNTTGLWTIPALANGDKETLSIVTEVLVDPSVTPVVNTAYVGDQDTADGTTDDFDGDGEPDDEGTASNGSDQGDSDPSNNEDDATIGNLETDLGLSGHVFYDPDQDVDPNGADDVMLENVTLILTGQDMYGNYYIPDSTLYPAEHAAALAMYGLTGTEPAIVTSPTTLTDAAGYYEFTDLFPGVYNVVEIQPVGYLSTGSNTESDIIPVGQQGEGSVQTGDSADANIITDIVLNWDDFSENNDFGEDLGSIGNQVYIDADGDGNFDTGEAPIAGVTVELYDDNGTLVGTATTDAAGQYLFDDLPLTADEGKGTLVPITYTVVIPSGQTVLSTLTNVQETTGTSTADNDGKDETGYDIVLTEDVPDNMTGDFGYLNGEIGNIVYIDTDGDGNYDAGEPGIPGVTIDALDSLGNVIGTTTTDSTGQYNFDDLPLETYTVVVTDTAGVLNIYTHIPGPSGSTADNDSKDPSGYDMEITPANPENFTGDFGYLNGSIGNQVYIDADGDGNYDTGEDPIAGVTVELYANGTLVGTATTDAAGQYLFDELPLGSFDTAGVFTPINYEVVIPAGQSVLSTLTNVQETSGTSTADNDGKDETGYGITLTPTEPDNMTGDFGYLNGSIGNQIYIDADGDGTFDTGEDPIPGVTVELYDGTGTLVATTTTDSNGEYLFDDLPLGDYEVVIPAGQTVLSTLTNVVGPAGSTADNDGKDETGYEITLTPTVPDNMTGDFGYLNGEIGNIVYIDTDGDGNYDAGEPGIPGVTIDALDSLGNVIGTTTTDSTGQYNFDDLPLETYTVVVTDTAGVLNIYTHIPGPSGSTADNDSKDPSGYDMEITPANPENFTGDFGYLNGSIGNQLFFDDNGDGQYDPADDAPIEGVVVELYADGVLVGTTTTDANGEYLFDDLPLGTFDDAGVFTPIDYEVVIPTGQTVLDGFPHFAGPNPGSDNNSQTPDGYSTPLSPTDPDNLTGDFGYLRGEIGNQVWVETDGDGLFEPGELPLAGIIVELLDSAGNVIDTMVTDGNGEYLFTGLGTGDYTVRIADHPDNDSALALFEEVTGTSATGDDHGKLHGGYTITLEPGAMKNYTGDFGYQYTAPESTIPGGSGSPDTFEVPPVTEPAGEPETPTEPETKPEDEDPTEPQPASYVPDPAKDDYVPQLIKAVETAIAQEPESFKNSAPLQLARQDQDLSDIAILPETGGGWSVHDNACVLIED